MSTKGSNDVASLKHPRTPHAATFLVCRVMSLELKHFQRVMESTCYILSQDSLPWTPAIGPPESLRGHVLDTRRHLPPR